ncbi:glycosyltransferase family 2 protein [Thalassotalea euphylliae]|uniref:Glycosyltransferase family 2 protein n=2 Tax=Thalassotalea euphylliae TaxID=1655234 RepID=A0A3E0U9V4_9GAMM|nr:glycosyltransferase family 2 protein [Thalassotalea euphylliae]
MNEETSIGRVISSLVEKNYNVIVVDDFSTDKTAGIARTCGATVLCNIKNLGAWRSTQAGIRYAHKLDADVVITMDADGQHNDTDLQTMIDAYAKGADVVIGSCTSRGSAGRHVAWRLFKLLNGLKVNDITSGFRLYNREAIHVLVSRQATMLEYQCVGILLMLRNLRLKIVEVPVKMHERTDGISRIFYSWGSVFYYLAYSGLLSVSKAFPVKKYAYLNKIKH